MRFGIGIGVGIAVGVMAILVAVGAAYGLFHTATSSEERQQAQDAAAQSLVHNGMMAIESAYVDTRDFSAIGVDSFERREPSIEFIAAASVKAALDPSSARKGRDKIYFFSDSPDMYVVGVRSATGHTFSAWVTKSAGVVGDTYFMDGQESVW